MVTSVVDQVQFTILESFEQITVTLNFPWIESFNSQELLFLILRRIPTQTTPAVFSIDNSGNPRTNGRRLVRTHLSVET